MLSGVCLQGCSLARIL